MTTRSTSRLLFPLLLLLLAACTGCLFGNPESTDPPDIPVEYLDYWQADEGTAIANLVENFRLAWENLDLNAYRDSVLYDGNIEATDGEVYNAFIFYYDPAGAEPGQELPETDSYERELERVTRMFGGLPGSDPEGNVVPGIRSISLTLQPEGVWSNAQGSNVEGDAFPPGTKEGYYETDMTITLKGTYGEDTNAWQVRDRLRFHVIPVHEPGSALKRFKIWKWRDIITL